MNHYRVLLNMSADKLHFLSKRYNHSEAFLMIFTVENIFKVNLFLSH